MLNELLGRSGQTSQPPSAIHGGISYRPEIDGLRALAVVSVILFHAHFRLFGYEPFKGGYVGVDVFFVISGYLIARIIFDDLEGKTFSLARFYERRVRRILPALLLVVSATVVASLLILTPDPFLDLSRSSAAVIFFVANIFFYRRDDYFAEPSDLTPLLHTWSLSVEEQFYVLFPLLTILTWKFARAALTPLLFAGMTASLFLAIHANRSDPAAAFYLFHNRAWEILAGCILASLQYRRDPTLASAIVTVWPLVGIALILISICVLGTTENSVGWNNVFAVAGTALVIRFGRGKDPMSRLLAFRPVVGLGLISYSLYLWHQPVFALTRSYRLTAPDGVAVVALILLCLCLAYLSWRFVELPFRRGNGISRRRLAFATISSSVILLAFAGLGELTAGFPKRFTADQLALLAIKPQRGTAIVNDRNCRRQSIKDACIIGKPHANPTFAVLGDSHAETLTGPLGERLNELSLAAYVYTYPACPFILGVDPIDGKAPCAEFEDRVMAALNTHRISSVIVNDRSTAYITGTPFNNGEGGIEPGSIAPVRPLGFRGSAADRMTASAAALRKSLLRLLDMGITVYYVLPVPEVGWHVPRTLVKLIAQNKSELTTSLPVYLQRHRILLDLARELQDRKGFVPIYPHHLLCNSATARCNTHTANTVYYTDTDHLSREGAEMLATVIASEIRSRQPGH